MYLLCVAIRTKVWAMAVEQMRLLAVKDQETLVVNSLWAVCSTKQQSRLLWRHFRRLSSTSARYSWLISVRLTRVTCSPSLWSGPWPSCRKLEGRQEKSDHLCSNPSWTGNPNVSSTVCSRLAVLSPWSCLPTLSTLSLTSTSVVASRTLRW